MRSDYSGAQLTALVALRFAIGWHFFYEGVSKAVNAYWTSAGYLDQSQGFLSEWFVNLASNPGTLAVVDLLNVWGLILVGLAAPATAELGRAAKALPEWLGGRLPASVIDFGDEEGVLITSDRYSGHIYRDPRVRVVSEDARTYVRRHEGRFDVIYSLSSNTWAALGSGSFAFAESYLFTTEAFRDYWRALSDEGFLSMEHQVYMPRLVSAVLEALDDLGVEPENILFDDFGT